VIGERRGEEKRREERREGGGRKGNGDFGEPYLSMRFVGHYCYYYYHYYYYYYYYYYYLLLLLLCIPYLYVLAGSDINGTDVLILGVLGHTLGHKPQLITGDDTIGDLHPSFKERRRRGKG